MVIPAYFIHQLIGFDYTSRIKDILLMSGLGILMLFIYYYVTVYFGLTQKIFNIKDISIKKLIKRLRS